MLTYFLRSWRVTFLLIIGLAALGIWTVITLPRESAPEIEIPVALVVTAYPGAAAADVEELVTKPLEDELLNVEGLEQLTSSSRLGVSQITVEFSADEDLTEALDRLREATDRVRDLPAAAEAAQVVEINFADQPILSVSLGGIDDLRLLGLLAEELAEKIEEIPGVSAVDVAGGSAEEIQIVFDPGRLADLGLSVGQLLAAISAGNVNAPFGQLETEKFGYDLRLVGRFMDVGDVANLPVVIGDGTAVPLKEIAEVKLTLNETSSSSRVSVGGEASEPAVTLSVRKKTGGNIIEIVDAVEAEVLKAQEESLPAGVRLVTFADQAEEIRRSLRNVTQSGAQTLLIVFGLLWLFLGWRAAAITSLAVPLTFAISFLVFDQTDTSLNGISLFSLILSLGLLVDTAIVVVEGIFSGQEENLTERAAGVIQRFKKPLIGGTLTTVAAFFPMLLVTGIIGQFLKVIPIVVTATLVASLFVALAFIPPVAVRTSLPPAGGASPGKAAKRRLFDIYFEKILNRYDRLIDKLLQSRRWQKLFIGALVILLAAGLALPFTGLLRTGLFPAVDIDFMIINVELPPGSRLAQTEKVNAQIEQALGEIPEVASYVANAGSAVSLDIGGGGSAGAALGSFFVNLEKDRPRTSLQIAEELRGRLRDIGGAQITVEEVSAGPPTAAPIEMRVIGEDMAELERLSAVIMEELSALAAIDVERDLKRSAGEFNFVFNDTALAEAGLSAGQVAQALRASVFGIEATTFLDKRGEEVAVRLQAREETVDAVEDVLALPLLTSRGEPILLRQVAQANLSSSPDAIRHRDGERAVTISAKPGLGGNANEITTQLQEVIEEKNILPAGFRSDFGGEQEETVETFNQLYRSMIIAVILILLILVVEFNSYRQPLIIFLSIPLALIGVLFGLLITGGQLNFAAFIGLVSLMGIVVNNAIILVDRMNSMREAGMELLAAVKEAARSRLRPIILTTVTTAAGVAPLIWVDEFFRDMALTLITGLMFSALLTLVLIPVLYLRQAEKIERKSGREAAAAI